MTYIRPKTTFFRVLIRMIIIIIIIITIIIIIISGTIDDFILPDNINK